MKNRIKEIIYDYVESKNGGITFAELDNWLEQNQVDYKGSCCIAYNEEFNIMAWINMSEYYMESIAELVQENKIDIQQCSVMSYLREGKIIRLMICKNICKYEKTVWLPCEINLK